MDPQENVTQKALAAVTEDSRAYFFAIVEELPV
jgi:hypothetical protein